MYPYYLRHVYLSKKAVYLKSFGFIATPFPFPCCCYSCCYEAGRLCSVALRFLFISCPLVILLVLSKSFCFIFFIARPVLLCHQSTCRAFGSILSFVARSISSSAWGCPLFFSIRPLCGQLRVFRWLAFRWVFLA